MTNQKDKESRLLNDKERDKTLGFLTRKDGQGFVVDIGMLRKEDEAQDTKSVKAVRGEILVEITRWLGLCPWHLNKDGTSDIRVDTKTLYKYIDEAQAALKRGIDEK